MKLATFVRETRYFIEYLLVLPAIWCVRRMPERLARWLAIRVAHVLFLIPTRPRQWSLRNLKMVFGDNLNEAERRAVARRSFENLLLTCVESIRWTETWMMDHVIEEMAASAWDAAVTARAGGSGAILITAHLGNFETIPAYGHVLGFRGTVLYRPQNNWRIERLLLRTRRNYLGGMVSRGPFGLLGLLYALRDNQSVGLLVDTNTIENPVFVDFLGTPAATPRGAAALALATRCPVILTVCIREPDGKLRMFFEPPFELIDTGDQDRDVLTNTQQFVRAIEKYVLAYPEQYLWMLPRWRFRPDGTTWKPATALSASMSPRQLSPNGVIPAYRRRAA